MTTNNVLHQYNDLRNILVEDLLSKCMENMLKHDTDTIIVETEVLNEEQLRTRITFQQIGRAHV